MIKKYFKIISVLIVITIFVIGLIFFLGKESRIEGPFFTIALPAGYDNLSKSNEFKQDTKERGMIYSDGCRIYASGNKVADSIILCTREDPKDNEEYLTFSLSRISNSFREKVADSPEEYLDYFTLRFEENNKSIANEWKRKIDSNIFMGNPALITSSNYWKELYFIRKEMVYIVSFESSSSEVNQDLFDRLWKDLLISIENIEYMD